MQLGEDCRAAKRRSGVRVAGEGSTAVGMRPEHRKRAAPFRGTASQDDTRYPRIDYGVDGALAEADGQRADPRSVDDRFVWECRDGIWKLEHGWMAHEPSNPLLLRRGERRRRQGREGAIVA